MNRLTRWAFYAALSFAALKWELEARVDALRVEIAIWQAGRR